MLLVAFHRINDVSLKKNVGRIFAGDGQKSIPRPQRPAQFQDPGAERGGPPHARRPALAAPNNGEILICMPPCDVRQQRLKGDNINITNIKFRLIIKIIITVVVVIMMMILIIIIIMILIIL